MISTNLSNDIIVLDILYARIEKNLKSTFQFISIPDTITVVMIVFDGPKKSSIIRFITWQVNVIMLIKNLSKLVGTYLPYNDKKKNYQRIRKILTGQDTTP